jgi:surface protein
MKTLRIFTDNYSGYTGDITFYPYTGGTINIGPQVLPYDYNTHYYYGTYDIYFSVFNKTCTLNYPPPACDFSGSVNSTSFISTWKTDNEGQTGPDQIGIVLDASGTFDFVIDWGDGNIDTITSYNQPELIHTYGEIGIYTIIMSGIIDGFNMQYYSGDFGKILSIEQWGNVKLPDGSGQFYYCYNLDLSTVVDVLDTSNLTDISAMFGECYGLTGINNIELWDVSNIINMSFMFYGTQFNQPIGNWDVSNVVDMNSMFYGTPFNQPLSGWNVSGVTNMSSMFAASLFNQPIGNWDVSNVTTMELMFTSSPFNQPIGNWDVSNVINMNFMFESTPFNQSLSGWNVSNVVSMIRMFRFSQFNQYIGNWNVSNVTSMNSMFEVSLFNQDIGNWNISGVTDFNFFMFGKTPATFSTTNLDSIYNGWSTKNPKPNLNIPFGSAKYTSASSAGKAILTGSTMSGGYGWTITDGGI